jgi:integrase
VIVVLADDEVERALVVVAHPDDADFWAGGTVAGWTSAGIAVTYCVLSDGDSGGFDPEVPRSAIPGIRRAEQEAAAAVLGVAEVRFLGYPDGCIEPSYALRRDVTRMIRQVRPTRMLTWSPEWSWRPFHRNHPVAKVRPPKRPVDPEVIFGRVRPRTYSPEELGQFLAACPGFYRDHFLTQVATGLRSGELLGLRQRRVDLARRRIEVIDVRYDAGRYGSGYKNRPKSDASIRVVPLAEPVMQAVSRRLVGCPPDGLVFSGPGGSNNIKRGVRSKLSTRNYRRVYKAAVAAAALPHLDLRGPHDLRHTFATWLEDAGIPSRVIDELMGHQGGRRGERDSPMGMAYRHTTPEMQARVVAVIEARLAIAVRVVLQLSPKRSQPPWPRFLA